MKGKTMARYMISDEGATEIIHARNWEQAKRKAKQWLHEGWVDFRSDDNETTFARCRIVRLDRRGEETDDRDHVEIILNPIAPPCEAGREHAWHRPHEIVGGIVENPGVWGHGGGVIITDVCRHCGCGRITDTWGQHPHDGSQGHEIVKYDPDYLRERE